MRRIDCFHKCSLFNDDITILVVPPPNSAATANTLGGEAVGNKNPQRKDYIIIAERAKYPWLHCQSVGPLQNNIRGALIPTKNVQSEWKCTKQSATMLQCAQNGVTIVPVNDTQTQCTTLLPP